MNDKENKLMNLPYLQGLLNRAKTKPHRESGQNFLICPEVVEATLLAINGGPLNVTELGAGLGTLTCALLTADYKVRAIERDRILSAILTREINNKKKDNLELIIDDLREAEWQWPHKNDKPQPYQLVGNIPYNLSGFIIRKIVQLDPAPERVVLLLQKEVGERIVASPPNMSLLSLAVSLWGQGELLLRVPANCFWPAPKVESCLVMLTPNDSQSMDVLKRERVIATARVFFQTKRKQMAGVLKRKLELNQEDAIKILKSANIDGSCRPQELTLEQWRALSLVL